MLTLNDEATTNTTVAGTTIALDTPALAAVAGGDGPDGPRNRPRAPPGLLHLLDLGKTSLSILAAGPHRRRVARLQGHQDARCNRTGRVSSRKGDALGVLGSSAPHACWSLPGSGPSPRAEVGAIAYALGGTRLVRAILPAWAFLGLVITPPLTPNYRLVAALQWGVTRFSCRILDLIGVYHLRDGNVIRLAHRTLLVEEACSGIHSLYAVLAGTIFFAAWARRSFLRGVVLVVSAVLWVAAGNALRIVAVAALARDAASTRQPGGPTRPSGWRSSPRPSAWPRAPTPGSRWRPTSGPWPSRAGPPGRSGSRRPVPLRRPRSPRRCGFTHHAPRTTRHVPGAGACPDSPARSGSNQAQLAPPGLRLRGPDPFPGRTAPGASGRLPHPRQLDGRAVRGARGAQGRHPARIVGPARRACLLGERRPLRGHRLVLPAPGATGGGAAQRRSSSTGPGGAGTTSPSATQARVGRSPGA